MSVRPTTGKMRCPSPEDLNDLQKHAQQGLYKCYILQESMHSKTNTQIVSQSQRRRSPESSNTRIALEQQKYEQYISERGFTVAQLVEALCYKPARSRVLFQIDLILLAVLASAQPLTEMNARNLLRG